MISRKKGKKHYLKKVDFFGYPIHIRFRKEKVYRSWWGVTASLIIIMVVLYTSVSQLIDMEMRTNLKLVILEENINKVEEEDDNSDSSSDDSLDLNIQENFDAMEQKLNKVFNEYNQNNIEKYAFKQLNFSITCEQNYYKQLQEQYTGLKLSLKKYTELQAGVYQVLNTDFKQRQYGSKLQFYLDQDDQFSMQGLVPNEFMEIHLMYHKLNETFISPSQHQSNHEGDHNNQNQDDGEHSKHNKIHIEKLTNNIQFLYENGYPQLDNYNKPFRNFEDTIVMQIPELNLLLDHNQQQQYSTQFSLNFQQIQIDTDHGLIFDDIEKQREVILTGSQQSQKANYLQQSNKHNNLLIIKLKLNNNKIVYTRKYTKIVDFISLIGGLISMLLLSGRLITKPFIKLSYQASLLNELLQFEFKKNGKKDKQRNSSNNGCENSNNNNKLQTKNTYDFMDQEQELLNQKEKKNSKQPQASEIDFQQLYGQNSMDENLLSQNNSIMNAESQQINGPISFKKKSQNLSQLRLSKQLSDIGSNSRHNSKLLNINQTLNPNMMNESNRIMKFSGQQKARPNQNSVFEKLTNQLTQVKQNEQSTNKVIDLEKKKNKAKARKQIEQIEDLVVSLFKFVVLHVNTFNLRVMDNIQFFNPFSKSIRKTAFKYSIKSVYSRMDISYILQKLNEIDKLKMILLDQDQRNLLEYWPREIVKEQDFIDKKYQNRSQQLSADEISKDQFEDQYNILSQNYSKTLQFELSKRAFHNIQNRINRKLMERTQNVPEQLDDIMDDLEDWDITDQIDIKLCHALDAKTVHYFGCMEKLQIVEQDKNLQIKQLNGEYVNNQYSSQNSNMANNTLDNNQSPIKNKEDMFSSSNNNSCIFSLDINNKDQGNKESKLQLIKTQILNKSLGLIQQNQTMQTQNLINAIVQKNNVNRRRRSSQQQQLQQLFRGKSDMKIKSNNTSKNDFHRYNSGINNNQALSNFGKRNSIQKMHNNNNLNSQGFAESTVMIHQLGDQTRKRSSTSQKNDISQILQGHKQTSFLQLDNINQKNYQISSTSSNNNINNNLLSGVKQQKSLMNSQTLTLLPKSTQNQSNKYLNSTKNALGVIQTPQHQSKKLTVTFKTLDEDSEGNDSIEELDYLENRITSQERQKFDQMMSSSAKKHYLIKGLSENQFNNNNNYVNIKQKNQKSIINNSSGSKYNKNLLNISSQQQQLQQQTLNNSFNDSMQKEPQLTRERDDVYDVYNNKFIEIDDQEFNTITKDNNDTIDINIQD